jgi:hypothetical protein
MLLAFFSVAEPLGFFLEPYILSDFGAGVWAADGLPALLGIIFFFVNLLFLLKISYF